MMNRDLYLTNIADSLGLLSRQISVRNSINLYDINIVAETFYAELLNLVENINLHNLNNVEKNAPGIDLADEVNRVSVQVTSDNTSKKIKHTIEEFVKKCSYEKYDKLIILILTNKKKYTTTFDTKGKFNFDIKNDIWDVTDLIKKINELPTEQLKKINDFLQVEFNNKCNSNTSTEANEVETIIDLIEFISKYKKKFELREVVVDPEYKIYNRFKDFADGLISQYKTLLGVYGSALNEIENMYDNDEAQDLIMMMYLQDISIQYLDAANNDPIEALNALVQFFEDKLSENGKKYDRMAIKFYLINEMIKCSVFPNERKE
jgi:hypothetical protein